MDTPQTDTQVVELKRDSTGKFVEGTGSAGRPKGSRNRVAQIRLEIEESVRLQLQGRAGEIMAKAIDMALEGDQAVMKTLLDKMMTTPKADDDKDLKPNEVKVIIIGPDSPKIAILKPSDRPVIDVTPEKVTTS